MIAPPHFWASAEERLVSVEAEMNQMKLPLSDDVLGDGALDDGLDDPIDLAVFDEEAAQEANEVSDTQPATVSLSDEPLFSHLLRRAVLAQWPQDDVMRDFVEMVVPPISKHLAHVAAKGGDFAQGQLDDGLDPAKVARYLQDQSMRAHLINGLLPALHVAKILQSWGAPQFTWYDDTVRRVAIAGYVLHDWLKLPDVDRALAAQGLRHDQVNATQHRAVVEQLFLAWGATLGLDRFLAPVEGGLDGLLHDLIYVACNTQTKWGTLRNLAALPRLRLPGRQRDLAESLSRLADYLAYVGRDPRQADTYKSIRREIASLSDQQAQIVYHHLADVRGVLTNLIHNAALTAMSNDNCVPLLYAPSGVIYLARRGRESIPPIDAVADEVIAQIGKQIRHKLANSLLGFNRDGKGMKNADYYGLFFSKLDMLQVGLKATWKIVHPAKPAAAGKRFSKMVAGAWMDAEVDLDLPDDIRVDQLAEWCFLVERMMADFPEGKAVPRLLLAAMQLDDLVDDFLSVPRDSRAGGVGYHWYFAAGHYLKRHPGADPAAWEAMMQKMATDLRNRMQEMRPDLGELAPAPEFDDLRAYIAQTLTFGPTTLDTATPHQAFATELNRYTNAKRRGKVTGAMCALCSSSYAIKEQREAAILFAPQVYSNKLSLHGAKAIRDICSICSLETMLRQLLMNASNRSGGNFESAKYRYLYLYPTYYFTPETMTVLRIVHDQLKHISFTELRNQLVVEEEGKAQVQMDAWTWQRLESLLLHATPPDHDRLLRLRFAGDTPITFFFLAIPPGRDATDGEAWVQPAFLALLLPLLLDVKVVASESPLPLLNEATELPQTVFLDGPHAAIQHIVGRERVNLDQLLPALNRLAVSYLIHLDGNARRGGARGFDYAWQTLPPLAKRLRESSLYAFWYLKRWQRASQLDSIPTGKAALYLNYQDILRQEILRHGGPDEMSHARTLTTLYRRFYRGSRWNSNSILRPIAVASKTLLTADKWVRDDPEALLEVVRGEMHSFVDRVAKHRADGFVPRIEVNGVKQIDTAAIDAFATYFVNDFFLQTLQGDLSALRGKQLNLLKSAVEVLYRDLDRQARSGETGLEKDVEFVPEGEDESDLE